MQTLSVLSVEEGAIVVLSPAGERFRLPVDAALRSRLLGAPAPAEERRLTPREIQAHVRSGLSAEQVAALTGVSVASIERFVGPVLAERAYIVETALAVRLPPEIEGARSRTFGAVMGERLDALAAREVRWSSAKEPTGWILAVRFSADDTAHDARWRFDAKHMRLDPDNIEASTLSQQGVPAALTPRLRAIEPTAPVAIVPQAQSAVRRAPEPVETDSSRFDSAAFRFPPVAAAPPADDDDGTKPAASAARRRGRAASTSARAAGEAGTTAPRADEPLPETRAMDLLPAPRGRSTQPAGEVFAARPAPAAPPAARQQASVTPLRSRHAEQTPVEDRPTEPLRRRRERGAAQQQPASDRPVPEQQGASAQADDDRATARARRGRTSMPSWDEIVFGRDETS